jgi:hypothetical protein
MSNTYRTRTGLLAQIGNKQFHLIVTGPEDLQFSVLVKSPGQPDEYMYPPSDLNRLPVQAKARLHLELSRLRDNMASDQQIPARKK